MKTDNLLDLLSSDVHVAPKPLLLPALFVGLVASVMALLIMPMVSSLGFRSDYARVIFGGIVPMKQIMPLVLFASLFPLVRKLGNPEQNAHPLVLLPFVSIAVGMFGLGLFLEPEASRSMAIAGKSIPYCLTLVPVFSLPIFVMTFRYLKRGAPTQLRMAGFYAGMLAGSIGCFVYAFTCIDDNPLFWSWAYSTGICICGAFGALLGPKFLKW